VKAVASNDRRSIPQLAVPYDGSPNRHNTRSGSLRVSHSQEKAGVEAPFSLTILEPIYCLSCMDGDSELGHIKPGSLQPCALSLNVIINPERASVNRG